MSSTPGHHDGISLEHAWRRHRVFMWAVVLTGFFLVSFVGNLERGLLETTEGRYAECALEMLSSGNFLEPTLDSAPHWAKPPLAYWSMAAGMLVAGENEAGARLGTSLSFLGTGLVVAWLAWTLWGEFAAITALGVYATSVLPILGATFLSTDMVLTLWESLAVACYVLWSLAPGQSKKLLFAMWAAFGLAFLTKGPPGLLPLLAIIPWHVWRFRDGKVFLPAGLMIFVIIGLSWFAAIIIKRPELLSFFLKEEVVGRLTSDAFHRNPEWWKPFVIYAPVLFAGQLHWFWTMGNPRAAWQSMPPEQRIFLGLWIVLPLAVFCLAKSRLPLYVLPLSIPMTMFIAFGIAHRRDRIPLRRTAAIFAGAIFLAVAARILLGVLPLHQNMRALHETILATGEGETVALVKDKAYGLQFYAGGKLSWIGAGSGDRKQALDDFLESASGKYRVVAKKKDTELIVSTLAAEGLNGTQTEHAGWVIVSFEK
ncbi:ArnT family glycosyltransferase [Desulfomicrobium salsuginis]